MALVKKLLAGVSLVALLAVPALGQTYPTPHLGSGTVVDSSAAASAPRTLASRFSDVCNVRDYGAQGNGLGVDDSAAIRAALTDAVSSAHPNGCRVYFPAGTYTVASAVSVTVPAEIGRAHV